MQESEIISNNPRNSHFWHWSELAPIFEKRLRIGSTSLIETKHQTQSFITTTEEQVIPQNIPLHPSNSRSNRAQTNETMSILKDIEPSTNSVDEKQETSETFSLENHPPSSCSDHFTETSRTSKTAATTAFQLPSGSSALHLVSTGTELLNLEDQRISDLCCGVCCDLVRGCIIVNSCNIVMNILQILLPALGFTDFLIDTINFDAFEKAFDDDEIMQRERTITTFVTVMTAFAILFSINGIFGASKFRPYLVLITGIWYCIDAIRCAVTLEWINIAVNGCFAYPHIALFLAIRHGKMSRERYHIEKHCCCVWCDSNTSLPKTTKQQTTW